MGERCLHLHDFLTARIFLAIFVFFALVSQERAYGATVLSETAQTTAGWDIGIQSSPSMSNQLAQNGGGQNSGFIVPQKAKTPRVATKIEKEFSRPLPTAGDAILMGASQRALQAPEIFYKLLAQRKELSKQERLELFFTLNESDRRRYLLQLPLDERKAFLGSIGREDFWFSEDLQSQEIQLDLRQFGFDFFEEGAEGFFPDMQALVGPDYIIGPGDTLLINVWGSFEGAFQAPVGRNGEIVLPRVGTISVWGQPLSRAHETIRLHIANYFNNFEVSVTVGALRSIRVFVVGAVQRPGTYTVSSISTALTTLAAAGGPAAHGSLRQVQLRRGGQLVDTIDFYDFFLRGDSSRDLHLRAGDTLFIPPAEVFVGVAGDVRQPAIYELRGGETLRDALDMAGGIASTAYLKKIQIERVDESRRRTLLDLDFSDTGTKDLSTLLRDRDLIKVYPVSPLAEQYVRLSGYVARPGLYQLVPDMRLTDLILPYNNLLPDYFPESAEILRLRPPELRPVRMAVDLAQALQGDPNHDLLLQEHDDVRLFSRREMQEIPEIKISGAVLHPGTYQLFEEMTLRDLISAAGNLKRSAYLEEAEITSYIPSGRETLTPRVIVDLERALAGDPEHNLLLRANDQIFIRSIPNFDEKLEVKIQGEVLFPGTYAIYKGEKLSSVLERAGGYSPDAYLRGAVFTRESLKETQQSRLNQLILEQEQEIHRISSDIARGALSPEDVASSQTILEARKALLDKLKETPATGRMVLSLTPIGNLQGALDDIELLSGDTLVIPKNPQSVTVLGQVYNPVSLAFRPGQTVGHYLERVGGAKKDADTSEMFVVRADGTVISAQQSGWGVRWNSESNRWITGGFKSTRLYPGDTILVPEKIQRVAWLREIRDISTIIFQLALGAAAVASF